MTQPTVEELREAHAVYVEGPLRYPGGKDGMYQIRCACGEFVSQPGSTPMTKSAWASGRDHQAAKRGLV